MSAADRIRLASQALVLLGEEPIATLDQTDAASVAVEQLLSRCRRNLLGCHPWRFNRYVATLSRLADAPPESTGYDGAYQMPANVWRLVRPFVNARAVDDWETAGEALWVRASAGDAVELEYHGDADEAAWTPAFHEAVLLQLAADLAVPMRDSRELALDFGRRAEVALRVAKHHNAGERPAGQLRVGRFEALRRI